MKEVVFLGIGLFIGYGLASHSFGKTDLLPDIGNVPGLSDSATPKEPTIPWPERPKDMKRHAKSASL